jgi:ankyrin repeat protein
MRFCGWTSVYNSFNTTVNEGKAEDLPEVPKTELTSNTESRKLDIQYVPVEAAAPVIDVCCQELYSVALQSMAKFIPDLNVSPAEDSEQLRLDNPKITAMTSAFINNGLGNVTDALLCIVPALQDILSPSFDLILPRVFDEASDHRKAGEWLKAEEKLGWAFYRTAPSTKKSLSENQLAHFVRATSEMAELYRRSLSSYGVNYDTESYQSLSPELCESRSSFTLETQSVGGEIPRLGDAWLVWLESLLTERELNDPSHDEPILLLLHEIQEIAKSYRSLQRKMDSTEPPNTSHEETQSKFLAALAAPTQDENLGRAEALFWLCALERQRGLQIDGAALPLAAKNKWKEIVRALLELNTDQDGEDEHKRTALSYAAEAGELDLLRDLLAHNPRPSVGEYDYDGESDDVEVEEYIHLVRVNSTPGHVRQPAYFYALRSLKTQKADDVVDLLLGSNLTEPGERLRVKESMLLWAAKNGNAEDIRVILLDRQVNRNPTDQNDCTPISLAAHQDHLEVVDILISDNLSDRTKKVDINALDRYGRSSLFKAAIRGNTRIVKYLLEHKESLDMNRKARYNGETPLLAAIRKNHEDIASDLIRSGVDVDVSNQNGRTALSIAAENGLVNIVDQLFDRPGKIDINVRDSRSGNTPLSWAAQEGHLEVFKSLLMNKFISPDAANSSGRTPLSLAAENGHDAIVEILLDTSGIDLESKDDDWGKTPLAWAAENGRSGVIKLLLDKSKNRPVANINSRSKVGCVPLIWAAQYGHLDAVQALLDADDVKVDVRDDEYDRTPLAWAASGGYMGIVELLSRHIVNIHSKNKFGDTPFSLSCENGNIALIKLFVEKLGVELTSRNYATGETAFLRAVGTGREDIVRLLLDMDQPAEIMSDMINAKAKNGRSAMHIAASKGATSVTKLLLEDHRTLPDDETGDKSTISLLAAVEARAYSTVELLVTEGKANLNWTNRDGLTALKCAIENEDSEMVSLLLRFPSLDFRSPFVNGQTPLQLAVAQGNNSIVEQLEAALSRDITINQSSSVVDLEE